MHRLFCTVTASLILSLIILANGHASADDNRKFPNSNPHQLTASNDSWQSHGPYGATVSSIAISPNDDNLITAGATLGLFISNNGGVTWTVPINGEMAGRHVYDLTYTPDAAHILYAVGGGFVYKSMNDGANWTQLGSSTFSNRISWAVIALPTIPTTTVMIGTNNGGIYASTDNGNTWSVKGLNGLNVTALAYYPPDPSIMVAATYDTSNFGRIWKSIDTGQTWDLTTAISTTTAPIGVLAFAPNDSSIIYAGETKAKGNPPAATNGKTFRTFDGGIHWETVNFYFGSSCELNGIVYANANTIYLASSNGFWWSADGGSTWESSMLTPSGGLGYLSAIAMANGGPVYVGYGGIGVYRSLTTNPWSWQLGNEGLTGIQVRDIAADPTQPNHAYVTTDRTGEFRSHDGGQSWELMPQVQALNMGNGLKMLIPTSPLTDTIYLGLHNGIAYSRDGGDQWITNKIPISGINGVNALAIHPVTPTILYVGITDVRTNLGSVMKYDGTWQTLPITATVPISTVEALIFIPDNILLAGTALWNGQTASGISRSIDGGQTWVLSNSGLPNLNVHHLIYANGWVWASLDKAIAYSQDDGATWQNSPISFPGCSGCRVRKLAADPLNADALYAATDLGLYLTTDRGKTWRLDSGPLAGVGLWSISAVAKDGTTRIYAATIGGFATTSSPISSAINGSYTKAGVYQKAITWSKVWLPLVIK